MCELMSGEYIWVPDTESTVWDTGATTLNETEWDPGEKSPGMAIYKGQAEEVHTEV